MGCQTKASFMNIWGHHQNQQKTEKLGRGGESEHFLTEKRGRDWETWPYEKAHKL